MLLIINLLLIRGDWLMMAEAAMLGCAAAVALLYLNDMLHVLENCDVSCFNSNYCPDDLSEIFSCK
jgi:hypothetical protein